MDIDTGFARRRNAVVIDNDAIVVLDAFLRAGPAVANLAANPFGTGTLRQSERSGGRDDADCRYIAHDHSSNLRPLSMRTSGSMPGKFICAWNK
jgi:hypothetical protein